ncbi:MAG: hypothetical protein ABSG28_03655 [Methanoregula sp.]|jgi:hypothetical protein|uniref:hypothetical protein n=1 Tax=Methanoregula sp. TaxID=2052170 RepID=UPI003C183B1A
MTEPIFLKTKEGGLVPLTETQYAKEEDLQDLLADHPELIFSINEQMPQLLLVAQEAGIPGEEGSEDDFFIDHIFVDTDGKPTFVEVKRSTDTRIRREVIGQMFDYAAHARAYWTNDKVRMMFNDTCNKKDQNPDSVLLSFIGEDKNPDQFWENFMINLKGGNIRLIFVADTIPKRLQLIIEFLREYMKPCEVLALEVRQFLGGDQSQMIAPRYVGGSVRIDMRDKLLKDKRDWTEDSFMEKITKDRPEVESIFARKIFEWAKKHTIEPVWGSGPSNGSCFFKMFGESKGSKWLGLWTDGNVEIRFNYLRERPPFDEDNKIREFAGKIKTLTGISVSDEQLKGYIDFHPSMDSDSMIRFLGLLDWTIREVTSK